ncbi:MAG: rhomboid family intramembrane serine protease [Ferruginibacter sp.]
MNPLNQKIRLIFIPFLLIATGFICIYTFLHWLLFINANTFKVKEDVLNLWAPFVLAWIPVLLWLRPRVGLLNLKTKKGDSRNFGFLFIATIAVAAPTIVAQFYLETATGKLTPLSYISQVDKQAPTKYYTLQNHFVSKEQKAVKYESAVTGKHNENLDLDIYIACPIFDKDDAPPETDSLLPETSTPPVTLDKAAVFVLDGLLISRTELDAVPPDSIANVVVLKGDAAIEQYGKEAENGVLIITTKKHGDGQPGTGPVMQSILSAPKAWLCIRYQKRISNRLNTTEKSNKAKQFFNESSMLFMQRNLDSFVYLERTGNNNTRDGYLAAIKNKNSGIFKGNELILEPVYTSFALRNGNKFAWIFGAFGIGAVLWFIMVAIPKLDEGKLSAFFKGTVIPGEDLKELYTLLIPKEGFFVTPLIMYANVFVFICMVFAGLGFLSFGSHDLLQWGANYKPYTTDGQSWRLLSSIFLHGGAMHLLANMYGLIFVGIFLEPRLGRIRFVFIYVATGLIASAVSLWWHSATVSVGASGAIFGLYGTFLGLLLMKVFPKDFSKAFLVSTCIFIAYNLLMGLTGGIDNAAHIGGLLSGFAAGLLLAPSLKQQVLEQVV